MFPHFPTQPGPLSKILSDQSLAAMFWRENSQVNVSVSYRKISKPDPAKLKRGWGLADVFFIDVCVLYA